MIQYEAELKAENIDMAWSLNRGRICAVTCNEQPKTVGTAQDFRRTLDDKFACTITADEDRWVAYQKAALDGATLFAGDYPVIGPYVEECRHGEDV